MNLTTPNDDYVFGPTMIHLSLPHELVERILLLLDAESDLLLCRLVNKVFNKIIQSSTPLQYFLACKAAGVVDNHQSPLSYAERLEALRKREDAWRDLKPVFETTIKVKDKIGETSTFYELSAGNYFLCDNGRRDLYRCQLPSCPQDDPNWMRIPAGDSPAQNWSGLIADVGMSVYEHDLMVKVIFSEVENQGDMQSHSIDLVFVKFSTGEYHPLARYPRIHVQRSDPVRPYIILGIVGDNLALIVRSRDDSFPDKLFIFDWKTGHKRLQHEAAESTYSGLVFVSPELLLVPNHILFHLEVWYIPSSRTNPDPPVQICSLGIPIASNDYFIFSMECYGELSPFLHSMPYVPPRPFFPSPENSIIIVNVRLQSFLGPHESAFTLVMRRCELLETIQKWASPLFRGQQRSFRKAWSTNELTVHEVAHLNFGPLRLAQSRMALIRSNVESSPQELETPTFVSFEISPTSEESPTSYILEASHSSILAGGHTTSSASRYKIPRVHWVEWGPPISRWFQVNENQVRRLHHSTGQRYVLTEHNPSDRRKFIVGIADFNPHNVRKNAEIVNPGRLREGELEILDHGDVFAESVYMGLKCVIHRTPEYDFDMVLMDEERLLGLKLDHEDMDESVTVLYFG